MKFYIYQIYFPISKKSYIGQTFNLKGRLEEHLRSGRLVCKALWKYDNWQISVLHTCKTRNEANKIEIEEIRNFNSVAPNGYNLTHGGDDPPSQKGKHWKLTEEQKNKRKGDKNNSKLPGVGAKISAVKKDCKRPDVAKRNKGNKYGQGRIYKPFKESGTKRSITCLKKAIKKLEQELGK